MTKDNDTTQLSEVQTNQTHFAEEEPIFQETIMPKLDGKVTVAGPRTGFSPVVLVLTLILILLSVGVATLFFLPQQQPPTAQVESSPSPSPLAVQTGIQDRLAELNRDLQAADPTKLDLPFPPVQMTISIDPVKDY